MNTKKVLTGSEPGDESGHEIRRQLDEAGLELWQAPEGFWAIRLKVATPRPAHRAGRRARATKGQA